MEDLTTQADTQTEETPVNWDDSIAAAWKDITERETDEPEVIEETKSRDEKGKFAPKAIKEVGDESPLEAEPTTDEPEAKRAPGSWKKEAQADFVKLPSHIQDEVIRREGDFHKGVEQYKQAANRAHEYDHVLQPYMGTMQEQGLQPTQAIHAMFEADRLLRTGTAEQKTQLALTMFRDYQIDPRSVFSALQGQPVQQQNPQVAQLMNEMHQIRAQQSESQRIQQAREHEALNSEIVQFSQGKEHFEAVRQDMATLIDAAAKAGRDMNLDEAYRKAIRLNDDVWKAEQTKQLAKQKDESAKRAKEARRAASVNVTSRGVIAPKPSVGNWDDSIRDEAARLGLI